MEAQRRLDSVRSLDERMASLQAQRDAAELLAMLPVDPAAAAHRRGIGEKPKRKYVRRKPRKDPLAYDGVITPVLQKRTGTWAC